MRILRIRQQQTVLGLHWPQFAQEGVKGAHHRVAQTPQFFPRHGRRLGIGVIADLLATAGQVQEEVVPLIGRFVHVATVREHGQFQPAVVHAEKLVAVEIGDQRLPIAQVVIVRQPIEAFGRESYAADIAQKPRAGCASGSESARSGGREPRSRRLRSTHGCNRPRYPGWRRSTIAARDRCRAPPPWDARSDRSP